jgi:hypothetical protein
MSIQDQRASAIIIIASFGPTNGHQLQQAAGRIVQILERCDRVRLGADSLSSQSRNVLARNHCEFSGAVAIILVAWGVSGFSCK